MSTKPDPQAAVRTVHYVLSTHWDREWYQTFQDYRRRLVRLLDRVLDDIASGKLRGPFTTDGQSIVLEDYLEIRPERRAQVEEYARAGKLVIGPWFVLPDEWLVSGESLVRNIRLGREVARGFGAEPSAAGFVCDLFGHTGQLPQILLGFGIRGAFVWRGVEPRKTAHLRWQGSDGSEVICYRFGRAGYCDYTYDVRHSTEHGHAFDASQAAEELDLFLAKEAARSGIAPLLVFDGGDHLEYDEEQYKVLFERETSAAFPYEIEHSTLDRYIEEMLGAADRITDVYRGEMRESAILSPEKDSQWLIPGVLSSRVWIKQANADCQALLCHWAEPFATLLSTRLREEYPTQFLQTAWRWLLMNHPHDSICGCSIDEVHEDMKYRFAQCRQIAEGQTDESLALIARAVEGELAANEVRVVVANPLPTPLDENVELTLDIPVEWGKYNEFFGFEPKPAFRLYASTGEEIPYQLLGMTPPRTRRRIWRIKYPEGYQVREMRVALRLSIPAVGYTTLVVREGEKTQKSGVFPELTLPTRHPAAPGLATSECSMENEALAVRVESNGSLTVTDKRTGETYSRLLTFEDIADIGDGWYHGVAVNDQQVASTASAAEVILMHDGPGQCSFRVRTHLKVPAAFEAEQHRRSATFVELLCDSVVTLRAGGERIEVTTTVDNTACDHRLRVLFPSGVEGAQTYFSDSAFDVTERPISLPADNHRRHELAVETAAQQTWTAVGDGRRGLAVVSSGLLEATVRDRPDRPLALTLFRSTRRTVLTDGQPLGQLPGPMTFSYWIVPFAGELPRTLLGRHGQLLAAGIRTAQLQPRHLLAQPWKGGRLPAEGGLLALEGDALCTSIRQVDGATEVRLYNPWEAAITARLIPTAGDGFPRSAQSVDLESKPLGEAVALDQSFPLAPKQILTLRLD